MYVKIIDFQLLRYSQGVTTGDGSTYLDFISAALPDETLPLIWIWDSS